jgi:hypothetical protein
MMMIKNQKYSRWVGDDDDEKHEVFDGSCVVHVLVHHPHELCDYSSTRPDLKTREFFSIFHLKKIVKRDFEQSFLAGK